MSADREQAILACGPDASRNDLVSATMKVANSGGQTHCRWPRFLGCVRCTNAGGRVKPVAQDELAHVASQDAAHQGGSRGVQGGCEGDQRRCQLGGHGERYSTPNSKVAIGKRHADVGKSHQSHPGGNDPQDIRTLGRGNSWLTKALAQSAQWPSAPPAGHASSRRVDLIVVRVANTHQRLIAACIQKRIDQADDQKGQRHHPGPEVPGSAP